MMTSVDLRQWEWKTWPQVVDRLALPLILIFLIIILIFSISIGIWIIVIVAMIIIIMIRIIQSMARIFGHEKDYCDCSKINCKQNHVMSKLLCSESEECDKSAVKVWGRRRKLERHLGRWKHLVRFPNSFESRGKMVGQPDQARWGVFHLSRQTGQVWPDLSSSSAVGCLEISTNHSVNKVDNKILWRQNMHLSFWRPRSSASRGLTSETCTYCWVGNCDWRYQ